MKQVTMRTLLPISKRSIKGIMTIKEIKVKSVLIKTGIPGVDYCINPYVGCSHSCRYCYATFMTRYSGHTEAWGEFVDIKVNAPEVLEKEIKRKKKGRVIISSVTDAYQPVEGRYKITRKCLGILMQHQFPVDILTKSPLVLRDMDLIKGFEDIEVGITITTDDERIRKAFEPKAPTIAARIKALKTLHDNGIKTYVFIGPVLPMNPEVLLDKIIPYAGSLLIDRMNYTSKTLDIYKRLDITKWLDRGFTGDIVRRLKDGFADKPVSVC